MVPKRNSRAKATIAALALIAAPLAFGATPALARVDLGINLGVPVYGPPPVVVAPPPVAYAAPPVVYGAPPAVYAQAPVVVGRGGYWWHDRYGHRHWRRR